MRKAGILLPCSSLPSNYGIGDFGHQAYQFIKMIRESGFKIWQILPLNPLGYGNSPYQTYSSKAMDEIYISLDLLYEEKLISKPKSFNKHASKVEYDDVRLYKEKYYREAYQNFKKDKLYHRFVKEKWVYDFAVFMALKKVNQMKCWNEWPKKMREWIKTRDALDDELLEEVNYRMFLQYILYKQWNQLRKFANKQGIQIMGDIPIYVGIDSLDVWANQEAFLLDENGKPTYVAGVPADYFNAYGQLWGNPIYDWDYLEKNNFNFWLERLEYNSKLFDIIRIDHFRAFDTYWKIPASSKTALEGEWVEAPGYGLFETIYKTYPKIHIVAEDLGDLRPQVYELRDHFNLMGMRIVQHSFNPSGKMIEDTNLCAYTGNHDNETLRVWYSHHGESYKRKIRQFFKKNNYNYKRMTENMIMYTLDSHADYAILPMVDILNKDDRCRINFPGTVGNPNWQWKLKNFKEFEMKIPLLKEMIIKSKRIKKGR